MNSFLDTLLLFLMIFTEYHCEIDKSVIREVKKNISTDQGP